MKLRYAILLTIWILLELSSFFRYQTLTPVQCYNNDLAYAFGFLFLGPVLWAFVLWILGIAVIIPTRWILKKL